jgi:hypothetical protein
VSRPDVSNMHVNVRNRPWETANSKQLQQVSNMQRILPAAWHAKM